jgi:hypothetical protein
MARPGKCESGTTSLLLPMFQVKFAWQFMGLGMSPEQSSHFESRLQKLMELRWQREVLDRWLYCSQTPESQTQLREMLTHINSELEALEAISPD